MKKFILISELHHTEFIDAVGVLFKPHTLCYPQHDKWFSCVKQKLINGSSECKCIVCVNENHTVLGASIIRKIENENKLCALCVAEPYRRQGIGRMLFHMSLMLLDDDHPIFTLSEEKVKDFAPLLREFDFHLVGCYPDLYKTGVTEYVYNHKLGEISYLSDSSIDRVPDEKMNREI